MATELPQVVPKACGKSLSKAFAANNTGCPKKNALLSLKAYNSGLEAAIGTSRDSFGILRL